MAYLMIWFTSLITAISLESRLPSTICTAGQYLGGVMLPGMISGFIADAVGYQWFFIIVMLLCLVTFLVTALVKIDGQTANVEPKTKF